MSKAQPKTAAGRLAGLDLARYLAFIGMVIVNFQIAMGAEGARGALGAGLGALEGRAAASFVVLAGIGLGLAGQKALGPTVGVTLKRAGFLLALGLLNMTIFDADILHYYAVYFVFGALLLPLNSRALGGLILALNLGFVAMILGAFGLDYDRGWDWDSYAYRDFWSLPGFLRHTFFNGWHPVVPWLGFLLFGLILSRLPLGRRPVQRGLMLGGAGALILAEALSAGAIAWLGPLDPALRDLLGTGPVPPMPLYSLAGGGAAAFLIGACLRGADRLAAWGILPLITPAGRQTLTLYIAHILIGMGVLEALGRLEGQSPGEALWAALIFCALATLAAWAWSRRFKRGPIESVMRAVAG